jgi:hypothetical protein
MSGRVVLVSAVGRASGAKAAAAALACAGSDPDRPGLLIDVGGAPPRPALIVSAGARRLEERLSRHLPGARVAARGQTCHLVPPGDGAACDGVRAALPLARDSVVALHAPPAHVQATVAELRPELDAVLLRADLGGDRALTALAVAELAASGLRVRVLKRPLAWIPERRALFGVLSATAAGLPARQLAGLLDVSSKPRGESS